MRTQHWHLPADEHEAVPRPHIGHDATTHPPPLEDADVPLLLVLLPELDPLGIMHMPIVVSHVMVLAPPMVQSMHETPFRPQIRSVCDIWHMPVLSQQPVAQFVLSHVVPPLELLELVELPVLLPVLLLDVVLPPLLV